MINLNLIDCSGDVLSHSSRVLRVPYISTRLSWLQFLLHLPSYALGLIPEHDTVEIEMMNNYREGKRTDVPTEVVEVILSEEGNRMDIEAVYLTILPLPTGIAYYLYFFPYASFFGGVLFLFFYFIALFLLLKLSQSSAAQRLIGYLFSDEDDDESGPDGDGNGSGNGPSRRSSSRGIRRQSDQFSPTRNRPINPQRSPQSRTNQDIDTLLQSIPSALLIQARETHLEWQRGAVNFRRRMFGNNEEEKENETELETKVDTTIQVVNSITEENQIEVIEIEEKEETLIESNEKKKNN